MVTCEVILLSVQSELWQLLCADCEEGETQAKALQGEDDRGTKWVETPGGREGGHENVEVELVMLWL